MQITLNKSMSDNFANFTAVTTLTEDIPDSQTVIPVASETVFPAAPFRVRIGDELCKVTAKGTGALTLVRGQEGTTATSHSSGAAITHVLTAAGINSILNGENNTSQGLRSQLLAGYYNEIQIDNTFTPENCCIAGGQNNIIAPGTAATTKNIVILGGQYNTMKSTYDSAIIGGNNNYCGAKATSCTMIGAYGFLGESENVYNAFVHGGHQIDSSVIRDCQFERHVQGGLSTTGSVRLYSDTVTGTRSIPLETNYYATGTVTFIGVAQYGSHYHQIITFSALNNGFGPTLTNVTTTYTHYVGSFGPSATLGVLDDYMYAECSNNWSDNVKWFAAWEFVKLYCATSASSS